MLRIRIVCVFAYSGEQIGYDISTLTVCSLYKTKQKKTSASRLRRLPAKRQGSNPLHLGSSVKKVAALPRGVYCVFWALRAGVLVFLNISAYLGRLRICVFHFFPSQLFPGLGIRIFGLFDGRLDSVLIRRIPGLVPNLPPYSWPRRTCYWPAPQGGKNRAGAPAAILDAAAHPRRRHALGQGTQGYDLGARQHNERQKVQARRGVYRGHTNEF